MAFLYPENQVSQLGITNVTEKANFINQYHTTSIQLISTLAQILGGSAVLVGIYFAWKNFELAQATLKSDQEKFQKDFELAQEGQVTERFTRAVDQLGSEKLEIRLGGIYALERIANESEKDYWPIMEILTAYVRRNSPVELAESQDKISLDIQAILTVIGRSNYKQGESIILDPVHDSKHLDLSYTYLAGADFEGAHFEGVLFLMSHINGANFQKSHLEGANFGNAYLDGAHFEDAHLDGAYFGNAHLKKAFFVMPIQGAYIKGAHFLWTMFHGANLEGAHFEETHVSSAVFEEAHLEGAYFEGANFKKINLELTSPKSKSAKVTGDLSIFRGANLEGAHFEKAKYLTIDQLSKAKTLYNAKLDPELEIPLREKYPVLFENTEE
ncbi:pentapeptide repeat-containing protein [Methanosarcina sp. WWM596]|uniref:pentapeptide repeat-containing protein n=1 Tax=Methanosarcina sp. WWM596 TaxID=1434103 RepID=UPI00061563D2|nr:pentapeptide repeat-containing protein [Methanosarcina sp. WWM596]AKB17048.1 hypothetical protein MSWHS_0185 [Methanosarcina sp. WWM596]